MQRLLPDRWLAVADTPAQLRAMTAEAQGLSDTVLWLDGVERLIASGALDEAVRRLLLSRDGPNVILLATLNQRLVGQIGWDQGAFSHGTDDPLNEAEVIQLCAETTERERGWAGSRRDDPRIAAFLDHGSAGLAEHLAAAPHVLQRWRSATAGENVVAGAIIAAAVAARSSGFLAPLPRALLEDLHRHYVDAAIDYAHGRQDFADALAWASQPAVNGSHGCLIPVGEDRYRVFDYLTRHQDSPLDVGTGSESVWRALLAHVEDGDARLLGVQAYPDSMSPSVSEVAISEEAFRRAAESGSRLAMEHLGNLYGATGRLEQTQHWYRRAAEHGYLFAMWDLGCLHAGQDGDSSAADQDPPDLDSAAMELMYELGASEYGEFETALEADCWLRQATAGDPEALYRVGDTLYNANEEELGMVWFKRAADRGHPRARYLVEQYGEDEDEDEDDEME